MATLSKVKTKQSHRSNRAKVADSRRTAHKTFSTTDHKGMAKWLRHPGKLDVSGVDTKGSRVQLTVSLRLHKRRHS